MKTNYLSKGLVVTFAAAAVILSGCKGKKDDDAAGGGDDKKMPSKEESAKPSTPEKGSPPKAGAVAKQLNGAWAPTKESFLAMMKKEMPGDIGEAEKAMIEGMVEMMYDKMIVELRDGKAMLHSPDGVENETYEIVSSDDATGAFVVNMVDADGTKEEGSGTVSGDSMTMTTEGVTMDLTRLSEAEFTKRKKAISEFDPSSLIPGGAPGLEAPPEE